MEKIAKGITLLALVLVGLKSNAQSEQDVLRYGQTPLMGSARYIGMGGAFNALGGDVSALSSNPAGTGVFLNNEFVVGLGLNFNNNTGIFRDKSLGNIDTRLVVPVFGIIGNRNINGSPWKAVNYGYAYNRVADFYGKTSFRSTDSDPKSSMVDFFLNNAWGISPDSLDPYYTRVAFDSYLIDTVPGTGGKEYFSFRNDSENRRTYSTTTKGKMGENLFTVGANYNNKLYLGAAFTIVGLSYSAAEVNREEQTNPDSLINSFVFNSNLNVDGTGYNAKIGAIYRVAENLRFGVSYTTPTTFRMIEEFYTSMTTEFNNDPNEYYSESAYIQQLNYNLVLPGKIGFGASYLFGKKGLISVDYNRVDFSKAKYANQIYSSVPDQSELDVDYMNRLVSRYLGPTNQIKLGGEYKIKNFTLRAGYGYADNAVKRSVGVNTTAMTSVSAGVGVTIENMTIDFGLSNTKYTTDYIMYSGETAALKKGYTGANVTVLFRY